MRKPIPNFDGYEITEDGRVFSLKRNKWLSPKIDRYGYKVYSLSLNGKSYHKPAHRLVAQTYIPNPDSLPCINHINENKLDNRVENLEWCTVEYNDNYGTRNERMSRTKCKRPVVQILPDGTEILYRGVKEAWEKTGIRWSQIARVCRGVTETTRGTKWRYADEKLEMA
jgi:hypothetical protein